MSFSAAAAAAIASRPFAGILRSSKVASASLRTNRATVNFQLGRNQLVEIPTRKADYAYHLDALRTFRAGVKANKPYEAAAGEIIRKFIDQLDVLAPERKHAIQNVDRLYLVCPEPEDLAAFDKACTGDVSAYKAAASEIICKFWDRRHKLDPKQQLAIRSLDSLCLACPKPEDLAAFKKRCIADDSTTEYHGSRRVKKGIDFAANRKSRSNATKMAWKTKRGKHTNALRFATKFDEVIAVEPPAQPIKAAEEVVHANAGEHQFEVVEAIVGDEEDANVEFEAGDMPFIEEDEAVDEPEFGDADSKIVAVEDLDQPIKATEDGLHEHQFHDDEAAFLSDEGYEIAATLIDDAGNWIRDEEDHVQPIVATGEVGHSDADEPQSGDDVVVEAPIKPIVIEEAGHADEPQFDVGEAFLGDADNEIVAAEAPIHPIEAIEEVGHSNADEPQFDVEEAFVGDEDGNDEVVLHAHRSRGSRMIKVCC
jgi:hypothetical protein